MNVRRRSFFTRTTECRRVIAAAAVLALLGVFLLGSPSSAEVPTDSRQPYDAWGLRESLRTSHGSGFGGLYADPDGTLVLTATPGQGAAITAAKATFERTRNATGLARMAASPRVRVVQVPNSLDRLESLKTAVLEASGLFSPTGPVTMVDVDDQANRVLVGLDQNTSTNRARVLETVKAKPAEISFQHEEPVEAVADRFNDVSPFNAGDRIWDENAMQSCSSGFGVHQAGTGTDYLLTAAHCSAVAGQQDFFWNGPPSDPRRTPMGFSTNVSFGTNGWDTQLIRTESSTITWTATASRSYITNSYIPVDFDSNEVINEGATSIPWQSGAMIVTATDICRGVNYPVWGVVRICHLWDAKPGSGYCAAQPGDSGGPIVAYTGFGPLAVGQIVGGTCNIVTFHAVGDMLRQNPHRISGGLHLNTTSDPG